MKKMSLAVLGIVCCMVSSGACRNDGVGRIPPVQSCTPSCYGRSCGSDGCRGTCGSCASDLYCEPLSGLCVGDGKYAVKGSLDYEYMFGNVSSGSVVLDGPETLPAADLLMTVIDSESKVIGAGFIENRDGSFSIPVANPLTGTEKLIFSTIWAPSGKVIMAVLDPETEDIDPGADTYEPFTWSVDVPVGGNVGQLELTVDDNSGALFVFLMNRLSFDSIVQPIVDKNFNGNAVSLGILFGPWSKFFVPCTCYHSESKTCIGTSQGPCLSRKITIVDSPGDSSAWGWSVLFHEFGHYILDAYSKDNSRGGTHYFGEVYAREFSFSEGWATFMSMVTATKWFDSTWPVYWDIQGGSSFWVDFENGLYHSASSGDTAMVFPSVNASVTQDLDENWVARALYLIWDGSETESNPDAMLTMEEMANTISSERFLQGFDFALKADLINFLDSAICLYPEKGTALTNRVVKELGFPYHGNPQCQMYASNRIDLPGGPSSMYGDEGKREVLAAKPSAPRIARNVRVPIRPVNLFGVTITSAYQIGTGR